MEYFTIFGTTQHFCRMEIEGTSPCGSTSCLIAQDQCVEMKLIATFDHNANVQMMFRMDIRKMQTSILHDNGTSQKLHSTDPESHVVRK